VRVKSALATVNVDLSEYRIVVNLAPADLRKRGSAFDLAIAVATLVALGFLPAGVLRDVIFLGELSLAGRLHPMRGVVPHLLAARGRGVARAVVPKANEDEAALVHGIDVVVADTLADVVASLRGEQALAPPRRSSAVDRAPAIDDLRDVRGQQTAKRALEVAAAGGHNLLFIGPPGSGKTMLARRLPGILPGLTRDEALEVTAIKSVAGLLRGQDLTVQRPFRAPHHTTSEFALVGGGERALPGEVTLAHHGVLFLDELAEFRRGALEALRQPLEDGFVTIVRTQAAASYPARPIVIAATNPCPCGHYGEGDGRCKCQRRQLELYRNRLSGPLLDRIDLHVVLRRVEIDALSSTETNEEPSSAVRRRVVRAREIQRARFEAGASSAPVNAHLAASDLQGCCALDDAGVKMLAQIMERNRMSARAYGRVLRVARTIADLAGSARICWEHVSEATQSRQLDKPLTEAPSAAA
jgi:magnesium chelatase family protein